MMTSERDPNYRRLQFLESAVTTDSSGDDSVLAKRNAKSGKMPKKTEDITRLQCIQIQERKSKLIRIQSGDLSWRTAAATCIMIRIKYLLLLIVVTEYVILYF